MGTLVEAVNHLWNAPKDWSLGGGLIWATGLLLAWITACVVMGYVESKRRI